MRRLVVDGIVSQHNYRAYGAQYVRPIYSVLDDSCSGLCQCALSGESGTGTYRYTPGPPIDEEIYLRYGNIVLVKDTESVL